jgi:hypothetical protein
MSQEDLASVKETVTAVARRLWSWKRTATRLLELATRD